AASVPIASSPCSMIHSVVSSRSALLAKVSLPSIDRPPRAGGLTSSTTDLSFAMTTFSPAAGTLRFGQVAGSDQRLAAADPGCAASTAAEKLTRETAGTSNDKSNGRNGFLMASTPGIPEATDQKFSGRRIARASTATRYPCD